MKSKGFTLIEILIALIILSISLLALAGLMAQTTRNNSFGGRITEAATFAQDKLEELRAVSWAAITPGTDRKTGSAIGTDYARNWTVDSNAAVPPLTEPTLKTITITVYWNDKKNPFSWDDSTNRSIRIISAIANPDPK